MAMTGVTISAECQKEFNEMKLKKHSRFLVFKIENKKEIIIETQGEREKKYSDFAAALPPAEPRYAVCDVDYTTNDDMENSKLVFFHWSPENSKVKDKMLYAASKDTIKNALQCAEEVQATDNDEIDEKEIVKKFRK